jgi:hypothetical protein
MSLERLPVPEPEIHGGIEGMKSGWTIATEKNF